MGVEVGDGAAQRGGRIGSGDVGETDRGEACVGAGEEDGSGETEVGDVVAVGAGDSFDQPVEAEAAQVVAHAALGHGLGWQPEQGCEQCSQVAVGEPGGQQAADDQRCEQRLGGGRVETQGGDSLVVDDDGVAHLVVGVGSGDRVAADSLHLQEAPVGGEADFPQGGQVEQPAADTEVNETRTRSVPRIRAASRASPASVRVRVL